NPAIGVVPNPATTVLNGIEIPLCPTTDQRGVSSNTGQPCNAGAVQDITPDGSGTLSITPNILMSPGQQYTFILDYSGAGVIEDGMLQITVLASPTGRQPCVPHAFRHRAGHLQPFTES
ncbi:MAG TPA: hypothetical protein VK425_03285, partial [Acidimicrobiales bacterium]|nr:hypothetical protein [Acidimicrobiales bacterium]